MHKLSQQPQHPLREHTLTTRQLQCHPKANVKHNERDLLRLLLKKQFFFLPISFHTSVLPKLEEISLCLASTLHNLVECQTMPTFLPITSCSCTNEKLTPPPYCTYNITYMSLKNNSIISLCLIMSKIKFSITTIKFLKTFFQDQDQRHLRSSMIFQIDSLAR